MFANAEMEIAARERTRFDGSAAVNKALVAWRKICGASDKLWQRSREFLQNRTAGGAGGNRFCRIEFRQEIIDVFRNDVFKMFFPELCLVRMRLAVFCKVLLS